MTHIYNDIEQFLASKGFTVSEPGLDGTQVFTYKTQRPGRTMIINGQQIQEPPKEVQFEILYMGTGAEILLDGTEEPLEIFRIGDTDVYTDSLEDFITVIQGK